MTTCLLSKRTTIPTSIVPDFRLRRRSSPGSIEALEELEVIREEFIDLSIKDGPRDPVDALWAMIEGMALKRMQRTVDDDIPKLDALNKVVQESMYDAQ